MEDHGLSYVHFNKDGVDLKLKKGMDLEGFKQLLSAMPTLQASQPVAQSSLVGSPPISPTTPQDTSTATTEPSIDGDEITAPMVGTFYRKPNPESPDFVEVGSQVKEGQTICIIEAMKVMNEIKAERSGTITAILAEDASPVQFGEALFRIN